MSIKSLLNQSATLYVRSGYDADGETSFGSGSTIKGRFEPMTKRILLPNGQTLTIDAIAIVKASESLNTNDRVTYDSQEYKIVDIFKVPDDLGNTHHQELRLVKWSVST